MPKFEYIAGTVRPRLSGPLLSGSLAIRKKIVGYRFTAYSRCVRLSGSLALFATILRTYESLHASGQARQKQASRITSFETVLGHVRLVGSGSRSTGSTGFAPFRLVESGSGSFGFGSGQPTSGSRVDRIQRILFCQSTFLGTTTAHLAGPNPRECLSSRLAQHKFGCFIPLLFLVYRFNHCVSFAGKQP